MNPPCSYYHSLLYPCHLTPSRDIFLPCCNEPLEILENTYTYVSQLDYTHLRIWVLDDGARPAVAAFAHKFGFGYMQRPDRLLGKAGNLRHAFARTSGEFFAVFDTDFCPRPEFFQEVVPVMRRYANAAIVQTPQYFRVSQAQTWVEQGAGPQVEVPFRVDQVNRDLLGASELALFITVQCEAHECALIIQRRAWGATLFTAVTR
jgi:cellulose synthase/poly-beta-1,6-N-acetylglucosamine synthase-like glycosyltransferase